MQYAAAASLLGSSLKRRALDAIPLLTELGCPHAHQSDLPLAACIATLTTITLLPRGCAPSPRHPDWSPAEPSQPNASQTPAKDPRNKSRGLARSHSAAQRQQLRQTPNQKGVSAAKQREPTGGSKEGKARGQPVAGGEMRLCACAKRAELGAGVHDCKGMATEFSVEMIWRDGRIWVYTAGLYGGAEGQEGAYEESPRAQQHRFSGIGGQ